jgi:hypothetical protein
MHDTTTAAGAGRQPALPASPVPATPSPGNADTTGARAASMASGHYHGDHSGNAALVTVAEDIRTVREHLGWQLRATRVLADLLTIAIRDTLARIGWTVGSGGTKVARCCHRRTTAERRREFQAWCTAVGATPQPEITSFDGNGALRVIATRYDGLVGVVVLADVYLDDDTKVDQ